MDIGELVREYRESGSKSQQEVADALGIAQPHVSQIERGKRRLTLKEAVKFASVCELTDDQWVNLRHRLEAA